ncbi:MAG: hypothetical protein U1F30_10560 [Steroidobacteraceae bacterium]
MSSRNPVPVLPVAWVATLLAVLGFAGSIPAAMAGVSRGMAAKSVPYTEYNEKKGDVPAGHARVFIYVKGGYDPGPKALVKSLLGVASMRERMGLAGAVAVNGQVYLTGAEMYFAVDVPAGDCRIA